MPPATLDRAARAGLERIRAEPAAFLRDWLGFDAWAKQVEIAEAVRDHRRTAVKSCHGAGKSALSARLVLWFLHAYPSSLVLTTAPTANQVANILWRELRAAAGAARLPLLGRCLQVRYEIAPDWYALGFKAEDTQPDRFQGFHAENALVIIDEAAGVVEQVFEALDAVLTSEAARMLLIGNPTNPVGTFREAFHSQRAMYHTITISAFDTPNLTEGRTVRPYLITPQWIDDALAKHGEDSPYVQARVFAEFPSLGDQNLIPLAWIEAAHHRDQAEADGAVEAGLDVARYGGDKNALCVRRGAKVLLQQSWSGLDTMETVGKARHLLEPYSDLAALRVDVIGVGAGVADRLKEQGYPVVDVNVAAKASDAEKFANLRCELWWGLRERFREGAIAGPLSETCQAQLSSVRYRYDSRHTHPMIESKEDAKKRGVPSPDEAEALLLAFASTPPAASAAADVPRFAYHAERRRVI